MFGSWLRRRRIRKRSNRLRALLAHDQWEATEAFFEENLVELEAEVDPALRCAYRLRRWLERYDKDDRNAIRSFAREMPVESAIGRAWQLVERLAYERALAAAVAGNDTAVPTPSSSAAGPLDEVSAVCERLAVAIVAGRPRRSKDAEYKAARRVLSKLAPRQEGWNRVPDNLREGYARMLAGAALSLDVKDKICEEHQSLLTELGAEGDGLLQASAFGWACDAAERRHRRELGSALTVLEQRANATLALEARTLVALQLIEQKDLELAIEVLENASREGLDVDSGETLARSYLAQALAFLGTKQYSSARSQLNRIEALGADEGTLGCALFLGTLALIHETRDWPVPPIGSVDESREVARARVVKNRALWEELRPSIEAQIAKLEALPESEGWRASLVRGLVVYVDRGSTLDAENLARFGASVDRTRSEAARAGLREIQGELTARSRAVEKASSLIRAGEIDQLRELNETVLVAMSHSLPTAVTASVAMSLWHTDPTYDALSVVQGILRRGGSNRVLERCEQELLVAETATRLCTLAHDVSTERVVPQSPGELEAVNPSVFGLVSLLTSALYLRQGDLSLAQASLRPQRIGKIDAGEAYLRFYLAWRQGDVEVCEQLLANSADDKLYFDSGVARSSLAARVLLDALERRSASVELSLTELARLVPLPQLFINLLTWLVARKRGRDAWLLLQQLSLSRKARIGEGSASQAGNPDLAWPLAVLSALVAAQLGRFNECIDTCQQVSDGASAGPYFGSEEADRDMRAWCGFLRLEAEIGLLSTAAEETCARWPSSRRMIETCRKELDEIPRMRPYLSLTDGLLATITTDELIAPGIVADLEAAQRQLLIRTQNDAIERAIAKLKWRERVIEQFWECVRIGAFDMAQDVYRQEIAVLFGERVPESITLAMILVDWSIPSDSSENLQERLNEFERRAPEVAPALVERVRKYLQEGDRLRSATSRIEERNYPGALQLVSNHQWEGLDPGRSPIAVVLLQMLCHVKSGDVDQAFEYGEGIASQPRLPDWVRDQASFLLGHSRFERTDFPGAAEAFERITSRVLCGHSPEMYLGAANFNHGLQLLEADQKEKAFEAFSRALLIRVDADQGKMAPLFIHFGLCSLEARRGVKAKQTFELLEQTLSVADPTVENLANLFCARLGSALCEALLAEDVRDLGGDRFLEIVRDLDEHADFIPADGRAALERALRVLAICQEIRRAERALGPLPRGLVEFVDYLEGQASALEKLERALQQHDPMLMLLRGLLTLFFGGADDSEAIAQIEQATSLGLQSPKLAALLQQRRLRLSELAKANDKALNLFDLYLSSGAVPLELKEKLVRGDDLAALYRMSRRFEPQEIMTPTTKDKSSPLFMRVESLIKFLDEEEIGSKKAYRGLRDAAGEAIKRIRKLEENLTETESDLMQVMATELRAQATEAATKTRKGGAAKNQKGET